MLWNKSVYNYEAWIAPNMGLCLVSFVYVSEYCTDQRKGMRLVYDFFFWYFKKKISWMEDVEIGRVEEKLPL